jgi:hypothetical protein
LKIKTKPRKGQGEIKGIKMTHPIKTWLDEHHLKQWMFADMVGIDESTLSCYISGKRNMTVTSAVTIERETKRIDPAYYLHAADLLLGEKEAS